MTRPDGVSINYKYDALGRRVERSTSTGQLTKFVYDGQDVVRDIHQDGTTDYLNGLGVDEKLRQTSAAGVFYFTSDQLGSTTALTDAAGNVVERMTYDAFGNSPPSTRTRYTYTGREYDADTGLYYYRARWYDAQTGRFLSEDPIGFGGEDVNLYGYVKNNPLNYKDSKGLAGERFNYPEHGLHQDELEDFCKTNDCDLLMSDIQRLEASIHFRDRLERLTHGGLDAGHQQWLDKEVALLSICWAKYFALYGEHTKIPISV